MKEFKGTPGPWGWVDVGCYHYLSGNPAGTEIIDDGSACGEYSPAITPDSPDAKLIAAAPELLKELIAALDSHEKGLYYDWDRAEEAINKALGEEK